MPNVSDETGPWLASFYSVSFFRFPPPPLPFNTFIGPLIFPSVFEISIMTITLKSHVCTSDVIGEWGKHTVKGLHPKCRKIAYPTAFLSRWPYCGPSHRTSEAS